MAALIAILFTAILHQACSQYAVKRIDNPPDCPSIYCGWNCMRFIDSRGCVFCGPCHPVVERCPRNPKCPSDNFNVCDLRQGPDGCWTCICKSRTRRPTYIRPPYKHNGYQPAVTNTESATVPQQPPVKWAPAPSHIRKTPVCRGPQPLCSANCVVWTKPDGCDACFCSKKHNCTAEICKLDCRPEIGADGCPHCTCPTDVAACKEVVCDFENCTHIVDRRTGCAVACECNNGSHHNAEP